jgi:hypothetical protein
MADKKRHNLYTVIDELMSEKPAGKPRERTEKEKERFNLYTVMGWTKPSTPKSGMAGKKKK